MNLPEFITIKHTLAGQGLNGRTTALHVYADEQDAVSCQQVATFATVKLLAKWLSDNGYQYVPASNACWMRS